MPTGRVRRGTARIVRGRTSAMRMLQAAVACDDGNIYRLDVLDYAGKRWLVPRWIRRRTYQRPAELVCMERLAHQTIGNVYADPPQIIVNNPLPKDMFLGKLKSGAVEGVVVIKRTKLRLPLAGVVGA